MDHGCDMNDDTTPKTNSDSEQYHPDVSDHEKDEDQYLVSYLNLNLICRSV